MRCLLHLSPMESRHKVKQVNAYLSAVRNPKNPLHHAVKEEKDCRLARGKSWMGKQNSQSNMCAVSQVQTIEGLGKKTRPVEIKPYYETQSQENLGTHCHE